MEFYGPDGEEITRNEWLGMWGSSNRILKQETVGPYWISTVWLGFDHGFGLSERPLIYETMIFRGEEGIETMRHATKEEAFNWHERWVAQANALVAAEVS